MSRIHGDPKTIKEAQTAVPGDKTVYINMEALNELPDDFEAVITKVPFKIDSDFSDVGNGTFMPKPELMYAIAEAKGISGGDNSVVENIIEEIDINPMLCKPMDAAPTMRKMVVGKRVLKYSTVRMEDGSERRSSPCSSSYNVWERCMELWSKEEMYTEGYSKASKYSNKYENQWKRRAHFDGEMKFAHAKAESKAHLKTIRELAGLMTGYKREDLAKGYFVFSKIQISRELRKMETAARLSAISRGFAPDQASNLLFGPTSAPAQLTTESEPEFTQEPDFVPEPEPQPEPEPTPAAQKSKREQAIDVLTFYSDEQLIPGEYQEAATSALNWLKSAENAESQAGNFAKVVKIISESEAEIPPEFRKDHTIY